MKMRRFALLIVIAALSTSSCGSGDSDKNSVMPNVESQRLDVALSDLDQIGLGEDEVEVVGGGAFGVVDESNWTVCSQEPSGGDFIEAEVRLVVDRTCSAKTDEVESEPTATPAVESEAPPEPTESQPAEVAETFKMPNVVGMVLQDAQDLLQTFGSYLMDQHDATGLDRFLVLDSNWQVCSQKPTAGTNIKPSDTITLGAVKLRENCP